MAATGKDNPEIGAARAALRTAEENFMVAFGGLGPQASITGTVAGAQRDTSDLGGSNLNPVTLSARVTQPLFRAHPFYESLRARAAIEHSRAVLRQTEQAILLQAAEAYIGVASARATLDITRDIESSLQRELAASLERFRLGELTRTDVAQTESRLISLQAERNNAETALEIANARFESVTGVPPAITLDPVPLPPLPVNRGAALEQALKDAPGLWANRHAVTVARQDIEIAGADLMPSADAFASQSYSNSESVRGRTDEYSQIGLQVTIPLFQGGSDLARVRAARSEMNRRELELSLAERNLREQAFRLWEQLTGSRALIAINVRRIQAATDTLNGARSEARLGTRSVVDVLNAEQEALLARVGLVRAQQAEATAVYGLLALLGAIGEPKVDEPPPKDLGHILSTGVNAPSPAPLAIRSDPTPPVPPLPASPRPMVVPPEGAGAPEDLNEAQPPSGLPVLATPLGAAPPPRPVTAEVVMPETPFDLFEEIFGENRSETGPEAAEPATAAVDQPPKLRPDRQGR